MAKTVEFNWRPAVPERLLRGDLFDRWEEETGILEENVLFRVDEYGFFLHWQPEGKDGQVLELTFVCDVRQGRQPNDQNLLNKLSDKTLTNGWCNIDQRTIVISSGPDLVNITNLVITGSNDKSVKEWLESLQKIAFNHKSKNLSPMNCLFKYWMKIRLQLNSEKKIPVRSITRTFASGKNERIIFQCLKDLGFQAGKNDAINVEDFTFKKFIELYRKMCPRTDIEDLFRNISKGQEFLTIPALIEFSNEYQRDPRLNEIIFPYYDHNSTLRLINLYEPNVEYKEKERMSKEGFYNFLMSEDNAPVFLDRLDVYQDMDQPLCHYFINSSHNTYLIGRQFGGKSSVEMYRRVLLAGCRCIELDCWDGQEDQEPIITHGMALCTDILFKDVMEAIADSAFVTSEFPVILSFENHCSKKQQERLAKHCEKILGNLLLTKPFDSHPLEPGKPLPSPNILKRKILIKNKRLKPEVEKRQLELLKAGKLNEINEANDEQNVVEGEDAEETARNQPRPIVEDAHPELYVDAEMESKKPVTFNLLIKKTQYSNASGQLSEEEERALVNQYQYTGATTNIHPLLSSMVNYAQPVKFQGFEVSKRKNIHYHMSSFNENAALTHLRSDPIEFVNYNTRQMSRIYPKGGRVDSSNYMPQIFWNNGCQMVSLNFQSPDLGMQLNMGKFEYNGNCGMLLKPDFLRRSDKYFDPFSESPVDGVIAAFCSIKIISGQFLSEKRIGTYVEVDMYGLPTDTIRREFRTKTVPNNGLNPYYNEDPFVFRKIILPDLACLRIGVYEETGKLIGQRVLPMDGLQAGFRHISLRTEGNIPLPLSTLFCHIVLKTYVPDGLGGFVDALNDPRKYISNEEKRLKQMQEKLGIDEKDIVPSGLDKGSKSIKTNSMHASRAITSGSGGEVSSKKATGGAGDGSGAVAAGAAAGTTGAGAVAAVAAAGSGAASGGGGGGVAAAAAATAAVVSTRREEPQIERITRESLKVVKGFQKLLKKQAKEKDGLKKKHNKERALMQKQHSAIIDKMNASNCKQSSGVLLGGAGGGLSSVASVSTTYVNNSSNLNSVNANSSATLVGGTAAAPNGQVNNGNTPTTTLFVFSDSIASASAASGAANAANDDHNENSFKAKMKEMVQKQSQLWAELIEKQQNEEKQLNNEHVEQQCQQFLALLIDAQKQRKKDVEIRQKKETDQLKTNQAKQSVEDSKRLQSEKSFRNKQEKDRRLRELNCNNMKRFIDERKRLANKHKQENELLETITKEEEKTLEEENKKAKELAMCINEELTFALNPSAVC